MDSKKVIIIILVIVCIALAGILGAMMYSNNSGHVAVNNTTNATSNMTNGTVNATLNSSDSSGSGDSSSVSDSSANSESSGGDSEPEFGSDEYVEMWDESNKNEGTWAYLHDQPVKTEDGHDYVRRYNPDSREGYWDQMN